MYSALLPRDNFFPSAVHPEPLLRVPEDQALEHGVIGTRIEPDLLAHIVVLDRRHGVVETQHMTAIGFTPACGRQHRRAGRQRDNGEALERPRTIPEKLTLDSIGRTSVLVGRKEDHIAGREPLENGVERSTLGHDAEARAPEPPSHQGVQPAWLDRPAYEVNAAVHLREVAQASDGSDLEVAEVAGQNE